NAYAPGWMAEACEQVSARFVQISTDYVFDGLRSAPYSELDHPKPVCFYGESKLQGGRAVLRADRSYVIRSSSLYGHGRENHASRVIQAVKKNVPTKIATDMYCSPAYTADLAQWIFSLVQKAPEPGLYHAVPVNSCTRFEFAERLCGMLEAKK